MTMPKVSVVVPVYNSSRHLKECLDSLATQTLADIEIICIDDGSTDVSWTILNEFRKIDGRFCVLKQENRGAAEARNRGLKIARGEYIIFLDSDDVFESDMIDVMYKKSLASGSDITICNYDVYSNQRGVDKQVMHSCMTKTPIVGLTDLPLSGLMQFVTPVPWTKLIRKSFLITNDIVFQNLKSANDVYFSYMSGLLAKAICRTDDIAPKIHYRTNTSSQISSHRSINDVYRAFGKLHEDFKSREIEANKLKYVYAAALSHLSVELLIGKGDSPDDRKCFFQFFQERGSLELGLRSFNEDLGVYDKLLKYFLYGSYDKNMLEQSFAKIFALCEAKKEMLGNLAKGKKTVYWGLGLYGRSILSECSEADVHFSYVCDKRFSGKSILGYNVITFNEIKDDVDYIFISTDKYFYDICRFIKAAISKPVHVINIYRFILENCTVEGCTVYVKPMDA